MSHNYRLQAVGRSLSNYTFKITILWACEIWGNFFFFYLQRKQNMSKGPNHKYNDFTVKSASGKSAETHAFLSTW